MIKIKISKDKITVKGHSGYSNKGTDIVCASVSSICITTVNALISINEDCIAYKENDGFLEIIINKHDETIDKLISNMINLLEELKNQYKENIVIERMDVS